MLSVIIFLQKRGVTPSVFVGEELLHRYRTRTIRFDRDVDFEVIRRRKAD
jgi:hypothetical protein